MVYKPANKQIVYFIETGYRCQQAITMMIVNVVKASPVTGHKILSIFDPEHNR